MAESVVTDPRTLPSICVCGGDPDNYPYFCKVHPRPGYLDLYGSHDHADPRTLPTSTVAQHLADVTLALSRLDADAIERAAGVLLDAKRRGAMVFVCGNGGSAATASHFACDLQKAAGVRAVALTDNVPLITAWANDEDYAAPFANQFSALMNRHDIHDVLVVLSCSGKSANVLRAALVAQCIPGEDRGVIAMIGTHAGGVEDCAPYATVIQVDSTDYPVIEDCHLAICHALTKAVARG